MSTVIPLPAISSQRLNDVVMGNVLAELGRRRVSQRKAAQYLGLSQAAFSDRVRGRTRVNLDDVERFAALLNVDPAELLARRGRTAAISEGGVKLPRLDSNQQPFD